MNKGDMDIDYANRILTVHYKRGEVSSCELDDVSKRIIFRFKNGKEVVHDITDYVVPCGVYLSQFGISATENGEFFFIQS